MLKLVNFVVPSYSDWKKTQKAPMFFQAPWQRKVNEYTVDEQKESAHLSMCLKRSDGEEIKRGVQIFGRRTLE
jgi:hypothetical protein